MTIFEEFCLSATTTRTLEENQDRWSRVPIGVWSMDDLGMRIAGAQPILTHASQGFLGSRRSGTGRGVSARGQAHSD